VADPEFLPTYQIELLAGRNFSAEFPADLLSRDASASTFGILMTESGIERFGIASPSEAIGQVFRSSIDQNDRTYVVIGVVRDFKFVPSESVGRSVAIIQGTIEPQRTIILRLQENYSAATIGAIEDTWKKFLPATPLDVTYMEEVVRGDVREKTEGLALAALAAAVIFLSTAVFGIYAQASAICEQYAKAIAIRKILGGSVIAIVCSLITQFLLPVVLSFLLAIPLAVYAIDKFYSSFQATAGYPLVWYACCLLGTIALAATTVFSNSYRVAIRHPINSLRYE
jgi:putative ABC transport system permease protein